MVLTFFSINQLIVLDKHCLDFFLHRLNLKFFVFGGLPNFQIIDLVLCIGIQTIPECQNALNIAIFGCSYSVFSETAGLIPSTEVAIELFLLFEENWIEKLSVPFVQLDVDGQELPETLLIGAHLDFQTHAPATTDLISSHWV